MAAKIGGVDEFLDGLEPEQRAQVADLRRLILGTSPQLVEHIKWNSPSYAHDGIDRLTMNVRQKDRAVQLILHMDTARAENRGAPPIMTGETGLIRWLSDIRGVVTIPPGAQVADLGAELSAVVARWLDIDVGGAGAGTARA